MTPDMRRRQVLRVTLGVGASLALSRTGSAEPPLQWRERALIGFGTSLSLSAAHREAWRVDAGLDAAIRAIRHVERQMSLFDEHSALRQLNQHGLLRNPDVHLSQVLTLAGQIASRSGGAFDVTMQPLWNTWAAAQREERLPSATEIRRARSRVDWRAVRVEESAITLAQPGMAISLNGIAQGYAVDLARARLQAFGIEHALLDTGEWSPLGQGPEGAPWTLALDPDSRSGVARQVRLVGDGRAIATSSDAHTVFSDDRRHHHIMDPRTGYSPVTWSSVTVAAPSCALADGLTKVMFMATAPQAMVLARRWGVDVLLVAKTGHWQASEGMPLRRL